MISKYPVVITLQHSTDNLWHAAHILRYLKTLITDNQPLTTRLKIRIWWWLPFILVTFRGLSDKIWKQCCKYTGMQSELNSTHARNMETERDELEIFAKFVSNSTIVLAILTQITSPNVCKQGLYLATLIPSLWW